MQRQQGCRVREALAACKFALPPTQQAEPLLGKRCGWEKGGAHTEPDELREGQHGGPYKLRGQNFVVNRMV